MRFCSFCVHLGSACSDQQRRWLGARSTWCSTHRRVRTSGTSSVRRTPNYSPSWAPCPAKRHHGIDSRIWHQRSSRRISACITPAWWLCTVKTTDCTPGGSAHQTNNKAQWCAQASGWTPDVAWRTAPPIWFRFRSDFAQTTGEFKLQTSRNNDANTMQTSEFEILEQTVCPVRCPIVHTGEIGRVRQDAIVHSSVFTLVLWRFWVMPPCRFCIQRIRINNKML